MEERNTGSFRDPNGFIFHRNGLLFRQINESYKSDYEFLKSSGLLEKLFAENLLVRHQETNELPNISAGCYKIIQPENISLISYPYEWCFGQLKDAALQTLKVLKIALDHGMILKDASAFNIQFQNGQPIFIDTLSFSIYKEGEPWLAYRQFCQHFLAPLLLIKYVDHRLLQLFKSNIEGIPLDLTSKLLPRKTFFNFSALSNIHLHAKSSSVAREKKVNERNIKISKKSLLLFIDSLQRGVENIKYDMSKTVWKDYYTFTNYSSEAFEDKKNIVKDFINKTDTTLVWDLAGNDGEFSRVLDKKYEILCFDSDFNAVEKNYEICRSENINNILPLVIDVTNPSPGIGWINKEREQFINRKKPDTIIALAIIHHLAISNNLPFSMIAEFLANHCKNLIIEFVPEDDSQFLKIAVANKEELVRNYSLVNFLSEFEKYFDVITSQKVKGSGRVVFLMRKK